MDHEKRVREAGAAFAAAVRDARKAGYSVPWPSNVDAADNLGISETGKAKAALTVTAGANVSPSVADKAQRAGQAAVDKVIAKEDDKKPSEKTAGSDKA